MKVKYLKVAQHSSSLIGAIAIAFVIYRLPKVDDIETKVTLKYWLIVFLVALVVFVLRVTIGENSIQIGTLIVSLITSVMIGILVASLIMRKGRFAAALQP